MVRPLSAIRRRVARRDRRLTLERGATRSPHTWFPAPVGVGPVFCGLPCAPVHVPPAGVSGVPPFWSATYACEPKLFVGAASLGLLFSGSPGSAIATQPFAGFTATL